MDKLFYPWFNICAVDFLALTIYFLQPSFALFFLVPFHIVCFRCRLWVCVHTAISQCGHTCKQVHGSVAVGWIQSWNNYTHPIGPFPNTHCRLWDGMVRGSFSPFQVSWWSGQRCENGVSRLVQFRVEKRPWWFVIGAEKTLSCMEKVSWNNGESNLSIDSSATRMGTTREASKRQSQRSFLFL